PARGLGRLFAGDALKPAQDGVAIGRVELDQSRQAAGLLGRDQGRAGPAKRIEYDLTAPGAVLDRLCDQRHRLDGRMHRQVFAPPGSPRVDPGIVPDVGAIAPAVAEPKSVGVCGGADLEHENEFVLAAVERPHAAIGLVPDDEVLELGKDRLAGREQVSHMAPIHAYERNGAVARMGCGMSERLLQEVGECFDRHLADPHGELAVANATKARHVTIDSKIKRRIREQEVRPFVPHQEVEDALVSSIPANQTMPTKTPYIAGPRDGCCWITNGEGDLILRLGRTARRALARLIEYDVDFGRREAGHL